MAGDWREEHDFQSGFYFETRHAITFRLLQFDENTLFAPHLTLDERRIVAGLLHRNISVARIAVRLGRHLPTIHPEIRHNFRHDPEVPMATGYWHMNTRYLAAGRHSRQRQLIRHDGLRRVVIERLKDGWSPEQIAGRLHHEGHRQRVCHETVYSCVYSKDGQAQELGR